MAASSEGYWEAPSLEEETPTIHAFYQAQEKDREKQGGRTCELCRPLENEVTELLKTAFTFRCIEIIPMKQRNEMERKLIATLARCHECGPSESWLGLWAYSEKVQRSGLWNSEYVDDAYKMTISDLEEMERHVKK